MRSWRDGFSSRRSRPATKGSWPKPWGPATTRGRGAAWLKVKPAHTLDLVVLAAEWGHGRRRGRLSNLHLGARDPAGGFVMLGKTFKGDRKSTRLNSSHLGISYAVFCLKKKNNPTRQAPR